MVCTLPKWQYLQPRSDQKMILQKSFSPYPDTWLSKNFIYPRSYLRLSKSTESIFYNEKYRFPWWFEDYKEDRKSLTWQLRNNNIPSLNLVPFAKNGDWLANFDGNDTSGNPRVIVVDLGDLPFHMIIKDFDERLLLAEQDYW